MTEEELKKEINLDREYTIGEIKAELEDWYKAGWRWGINFISTSTCEILFQHTDPIYGRFLFNPKIEADNVLNNVWGTLSLIGKLAQIKFREEVKKVQNQEELSGRGIPTTIIKAPKFVPYGGYYD